MILVKLFFNVLYQKTDIDKDGIPLAFCPLKFAFALENGKGCCHANMKNIPLENFKEPCSKAKNKEQGKFTSNIFIYSNKSVAAKLRGNILQNFTPLF